MTNRWPILLASLVIGGCSTTLSIPTPVASTSEIGRQILLTVPITGESSSIQLTGAPSTRYLRRQSYGASAAIEEILDELAGEHDLERVQGWPIRSLDVYCEVFEVSDGTNIDSLIESLATDPRVDLVQRMNSFKTLLSRYDDPYGEIQSSIQDLGIEQAHYLATGRGVFVAVIDSGVDARHPDLSGSVSVSQDLVKTPKVPTHGEIHGTAVAGVIASEVDNNEGIIGVAPNADIAALRACWAVAIDSSRSDCSSFTLALALEAAITLHAQIINLSLAGPFDPLLSRLLDEAIAQGAVIVAAYPEPGDQATVFPASHPNVIVAHSRSTHAVPSTQFSLAAPGIEILTTTPDSGYAFLSGNSLAAAHVSGVIALLLEIDAKIGIDDIVQLLSETSISADGYSTIHACRALAKLMSTEFCNAKIVQF